MLLNQLEVDPVVDLVDLIWYVKTSFQHMQQQAIWLVSTSHHQQCCELVFGCLYQGTISQAIPHQLCMFRLVTTPLHTITPPAICTWLPASICQLRCLHWIPMERPTGSLMCQQKRSLCPRSSQWWLAPLSRQGKKRGNPRREGLTLVRRTCVQTSVVVVGLAQHQKQRQRQKTPRLSHFPTSLTRKMLPLPPLPVLWAFATSSGQMTCWNVSTMCPRTSSKTSALVIRMPWCTSSRCIWSKRGCCLPSKTRSCLRHYVPSIVQEVVLGTTCSERTCASVLGQGGQWNTIRYNLAGCQATSHAAVKLPTHYIYI